MQDARTCLLLAMLAAAGASCALQHSANGPDSSPPIDAMTLDVRADANSMDLVAIDAPGDAPADNVIAFDASPCLDADFANDPRNCGSCGNACPQPSGGTVAWVAGQCPVTCGAGTHECSGTCASDTSATQCGAACATCPGAPNAMPACVNGACGFDCNAGFHVCNGTCADNTLPATCGASCVACTAPMNAVATCASGQCGWQCAPGYHAVGGACVSDACGNHALDGNEACDDGNRADGDGCSGTCAMESGVVGSTCPSAAGIVIRDRGTFVYSGDTSSASNSNGDCGANGGDLGLAARSSSRRRSC